MKIQTAAINEPDIKLFVRRIHPAPGQTSFAMSGTSRRDCISAGTGDFVALSGYPKEKSLAQLLRCRFSWEIAL